jgi:hypothetical protein
MRPQRQQSRRAPIIGDSSRPINRDAILCCIAISTVPGDDPNDPAVEMPWDAKTGSTTGLYRWCRAVLLWHVSLEQSKVTDHTGRITKTQLDEIIAQRENAMAYRSKPGR